MVKRLRLKKILALMVMGLLVFTNVSCAQQTESPAPAKEEQLAKAGQAANDIQVAKDAPQDKPVTEKAESQSEVIYLKVENAKASGFDETPDWAPRPDAMAVVDANLETRWASGYKDGEWIYLDLGKPKMVSKAIIKWETAYAPSFEILSSDDAVSWQRIILLEGQGGGTSEIVFNPVKARYIKLVGLTRVNPEWGISVWEFEVYGPKDSNLGEPAFDEIFKGKKEKSAIEKKRDEINLIEGQIVPSPGAISVYEFQRGVNYTSWSRDELKSDLSDYSLIYLSQVGVGHIALMTVYYQDDAVSPKIYADEKKTVSDESVGHSINIMHSLGMKVMLKPHVDLIDEDARSNIIPGDEWFANYKAFILHYAELAAKYDAELFCIGTELSNTTTERWKAKWLDIIYEIRKVYKGPLTYAANWDEYDTVSFWDEMDYIGMDAYFPLTNKVNPPKEELIAGWTKHADILENWLKSTGLKKSVVFTEVGYDTVAGSNKQPWRILPTLTSQIESQDEQANCLEALLMVMSNRPWFKGFYWWNYFPRPDIGVLGYTLRGKKGEKILTEWFNRLK